MRRRTLPLLVVVYVLAVAGLAPVPGCGSGSPASMDAAAGSGDAADASPEANPDGRGDGSEAPKDDCRTTGCNLSSYCGGCNLAGGAGLVYICIPNGAAC